MPLMATRQNLLSYLGLALTSLGFQTVQMDVGRLTRVLPQEGWRPELNANFGGNLLRWPAGWRSAKLPAPRQPAGVETMDASSPTWAMKHGLIPRTASWTTKKVR